jgi:hypothetical protein
MEKKPFNGKAIYQPAGKKGKEMIKSNGYYVVYRPEHPFAFGKGYVYEHRYIIEQTLGRYLSSNEIVHHKDGNKLNNDISNLELCNSIAEHKVEHRTSKSKVKRMPGEPNIAIKCACGCGREFLKYDSCGRERKYFDNGCSKRHQRIIRQTEQSKIIILCACGCGTKISKYDKYGRERMFVSGHNGFEIPNRTFLSEKTGLSFATIINYFRGNKLRNKTVESIEQSIIKLYGKDYIRK